MDTTYFQPPTFDPSHLTHVKELPLPDGNYEGELQEGVRQGLGIFLWQNGDAYFGSWLDGKMHGKGIFCYNTGHCIEGIFSANFINGPACLTYPDKSYIKAMFKNGELNGRSLFYYADKNSWALQDYEAGKLKGIYYEGKGKPMSYDFCISTYGEGFRVPSTKPGEANDAFYQIQTVKKELAAPYSVGGFELEGGVKHYGIIRNHKIEGLGIRLLNKGIEIGKYREGSLDGNGRVLEFGNRLYEGEFIQGKYYGKGLLCEWKNQVITTTNAIFTSGIAMHKINEEVISLKMWNNFCRENCGEPKVINLDIRNYEDAFTKDYTDPDLKDENSKMIETTIKEIAHAKIVSRETVIECHEVPKESTPTTVPIDSLQNSPSRRALLETASHLAKMVNAVHNDPYDVTTTLQASQGYIDRLKKRLDDQEAALHKPKRSKSSERNLEPAFSQVFSICVDDKLSTQRSHRSASRDTARYGNITINYPFDQVAVDNQAKLETLKNFSSASLSSYRSRGEIPSARGRDGYKGQDDSVSLTRLDKMGCKESPNPLNLTAKVGQVPVGVNQWYTQEPYSSGLNLSSNGLGATESAKLRYDFGSESVSPLLSAAGRTAENGIYGVNVEEQQRTLSKGQKNSRSSTDLHVPVEVITENSSEKVVKTLTYTGAREPSPSRKLLTVNTKKLPNEKSTPSLQSGRGTATSSGRLPVDSGKGATKNSNLVSTPTKGNKAPSGMVRANSSQSLNKKGSVTNMKTPLAKNPNTKDKNIVTTSSKPPQSETSSLVYVGSSPYVKKTIVNSVIKQEILQKPRDNRTTDKMNLQDRRSVTPHTEGQELTARRSARARADSPAQVVEVDLHSYYSNLKSGNEKRDGYALPEKSLSSTINTWSAQKTAYLAEEHSYTGEGSAQKTFTTERNSAGKQSARNKSPLLSNVVSIDISMFRTGTPGLTSEFDVNKLSPGKGKSALDHSPISYTDNKSSFISGGFDQELSQIGDGYRITDRIKEVEKQSAGYTYLPAKEILETLGNRGETRDIFKPSVYGIDYGMDSSAQFGREEKKTLALNLALTNTLQPLTDKNSQGSAVHTFDRRDKETVEDLISTDRNMSQIEVNELEKHKLAPGYNVKTPSFSLTSQKNFKFTTGDIKKSDFDTPKKGGRYEEPSLDSKLQQNSSLRRGSEGKAINSPERTKVGSPYKVENQKQRLSHLVKDSIQTKSNGNSPSRGCGSPGKHCHEHDSLDSVSGYYPVKKTCHLNSDSYYYDSLNSSKESPHKSSQKGSPVRQGRASLNHSGVMSPERPKCAQQQSVSNDNIKIITNDGINQVPEIISIGLSSNLGDGLYSVLRETRDGDDYKLDIHALPTVSSKYEHIKEDYLDQPPRTSGSIKVVETSLEKQGLFQASQPSSKAASTAYFGFRSGPATPQVDFDISGNYPGIYKQPIEDPKNDVGDYFSLQPENFAARPGIKRPQLVVESKIAVAPASDQHEYNYIRTDYVKEVPVEASKKSPVKTNNGDVSHRSSVGATFSARSSVQEEWGSMKEVQSLYSAHFGSDDNRLTKLALNPQHQHVQIKRLPEEIRVALMSKSQYDSKRSQAKRREESEQTFGSAVANFNAEKGFRPPKDMNRSKSVNKLQGRKDGSRSKGVHQRYNIADEDDISEEKNGNLRQDLVSARKTETKRASAQNDFSGASLKRTK